MKSSDLILYAVTDRRWLKGQSLASDVLKSIKGGISFLQLREKALSDEDFLKEAEEIKKLCKDNNIPFVINDNVDVAIKCDADGVHVGQHDCVASDVRKRIGKNKILGVSAQTVEQALLAEKMGADYLGVGAVFPTGSKDDADSVSMKTLIEICNAVSIPVVAIGGINLKNIENLKGTGIAGVAVISAIYGEENIEEATKNLRCKAEMII